MGALGDKGKYTALGLRRQGQSSQGLIECLHSSLPAELLDECPDLSSDEPWKRENNVGSIR
jgi:hypothetical protein